MNLYLYSPIRCLANINNQTFEINANPLLCNLLKPQLINFDLGSAFETATYYCHDNFCKNVAITDLYDGIFVCVKPKPRFNLPYKVLFEKSIVCQNTEFLLTAYTDSCVKLKCRGYNQETILQIPFVPKNIDAYPVGDNLFLVVLKSNLNCIILFSAPLLKVEFFDVCNEFSINKELIVKKVHNNIGTHTEVTRYVYKNKIEKLDRSISTVYPYKNIPEQILPLAFLEEVRLCADYSRFLSAELSNDATMIKDFLGDFTIVLPPFLNGFDKTFAIINQKAKYLKFVVEDGKIKDIHCEDFPF